MQPKIFPSLNRSLFLMALLLICSLATYAQRKEAIAVLKETDELEASKLKIKKEVKIHVPDTSHNPGLAFRRSGFIPGWGQAYNHKLWKVPVIYGGIGLLGSAVVYNQRYYKQFLTVYKLRNDPTLARPAAGTPIRILYDRVPNKEAAAAALSGHQRNMQLSILGIAGAWGIQMIDAYIDAKFRHSYSMDRNLSFNLTPGIITTGPTYAVGNVPGVMPAMNLLVSL